MRRCRIKPNSNRLTAGFLLVENRLQFVDDCYWPWPLLAVMPAKLIEPHLLLLPTPLEQGLAVRINMTHLRRSADRVALCGSEFPTGRAKGATALEALRFVATVSKPLFADDLNSRKIQVVKSKLQRGLYWHKCVLPNL